MYKTIGMDRVLEVASNPGTGAVTLGGAVLGFRTFSSVMSTSAPADTCAYFIEAVDANGVPNGGWERGFGTIAAGPALARTIVTDSSNAGALVNFTGSVRIGCSPTSESLFIHPVPGGRLSFTAGNPVVDGSGSTIYYAAYLHDKIMLWNNAGFVAVTIPAAGVSIPLTGVTAAGTAYDLYAYVNGKNLAFDVPYAWANTTAGANIQYNNGIITKIGDPSRRYMGSFYCQTAGTSSDTANGGATSVGGKRFLWNMYNRIPKPVWVYDNTASWTYSGTFRICRGQATPANSIEVFLGRSEEAIIANFVLVGQAPLNITWYGRIGVDGSGVGPTQSSAAYNFAMASGNVLASAATSWAKQIGVGYHTLNMMEQSSSGTTTFYGAGSGLTALNALVYV